VVAGGYSFDFVMPRDVPLSRPLPLSLVPRLFAFFSLLFLFSLFPEFLIDCLFVYFIFVRGVSLDEYKVS
jgi:hypothetical protein